MTENEFEDSFKNAIRIVFLKTIDYSVEPPVIAVIFENDNKGIKAYEFLQSEFLNNKICLVCRLIDDKKINLTIIDSKNTKIFNIYNLSYSKTELIDFRQNSKFGKYTVFCISKLINSQLILSSVVRERPLLVSELVFSE